MSKNLSTENLSVGYGKRIVIDGVDVEIASGRITTLIGPNGCGKSTILKTVLGQLSPIKGTVYIGGEDSLKVKREIKAKAMAMVMTKRPKTELMTCFDVVATGRYPYTGRFGILSDEDNEKVKEALDYIGAYDLAESDFSCLSDGQKQRVMVARAIAQEPEILILDEPTSFLDIHYKLDILKCVKKLTQEKNVAVIMSLHELELARAVSDVIIAVENGKIGRIGGPEDIFKDGYIPRLYDIDPGNFDEETGTLIMPGLK